MHMEIASTRYRCHEVALKTTASKMPNASVEIRTGFYYIIVLYIHNENFQLGHTKPLNGSHVAHRLWIGHSGKCDPVSFICKKAF